MSRDDHDPDPRGRAGRALPRTERRDVHLWFLVLGAMVADIGLTLVGLGMGLIETNPIALFGIETVGYAVLAYLKVPALLLGVVGWISLSRTARRLNLVGLALPWVAASLVNLFLVAGLL